MAAGGPIYNRRMSAITHPHGPLYLRRLQYVLDRVRDGITTHPDNNLREYIEYGGRSTGKPLRYSAVENTFYQFFIYRQVLTTPFNYRFQEGANPRQLEIAQTVRLMNIVADEIYINQFDPARGTQYIESDVQKGKDIEACLCPEAAACPSVMAHPFDWKLC